MNKQNEHHDTYTIPPNFIEGGTLFGGMFKIKEQVDFLFNRATELGMEKICAFAVYQMAELFDFKNVYAVLVAETILKKDPDFIHTIVSPKEKKEYRFVEQDISERFFADSRKKLLQEVRVE